jgi:uncharacterized delta-60 repeat protein
MRGFGRNSVGRENRSDIQNQQAAADRRAALGRAVLETLEERCLLSGSPLSVVGPSISDEGSSYTLNLGSTAPLANWTINWGDGNSQTVDGSATSATHTFTDGAQLVAITGSATDTASNSYDFGLRGPAVDATFGTDGYTDAAFGARALASRPALAVQADGKIIAAGDDLAGGDFKIGRYNADGTLDTSFNTNGFAYADIPGDTDGQVQAATVQADGKVVVVGNVIDGSYSAWAIVRYNTDGSLDQGFGTDGYILHPTTTSDNNALHAVTTTASGKILVGGGTDGGFALAQYNADGTPDTTFGGNGTGLVVTHVGSSDVQHGQDSVQSLQILPDGSIIAAGIADATTHDFALAKYTPAGQLDTSFGNGGTVTTPLDSTGHVTPPAGNSTQSRIRSAVIQSDGKIVVLGSVGSLTSNSDWVVARYNADGSLDTTFSDDGVTTADFAGTGAEGYSVSLDVNGRIVGTGMAIDNGVNELALARWNADGTADVTFDGDGELTILPAASATTGASLFSTAWQGDTLVGILGGFDDIRLGRFDLGDSVSVSVHNVAPTVSILGVPDSGFIDSEVTLSAAVTDPGAEDTAAGFTYSWTVTQDGFWEFASGTDSTLSFTPDAYYDTTYGITLTVTDQDGGTTVSTASFDYITPGTSATFSNSGPVAAGGTATVSFTDVTGVGPFTYAYDWDNDGVFDYPGQFDTTTESTVTVPAEYLLTPGTLTVHGLIQDDNFNTTEYTTDIIITEAAPTGPTATLANSGPVDEGAGTAVVSFADQAGVGPFTYSYDFDNDGTFEIVGSTSASATVPSLYATDGPGSITVAGRITDANGASADYTTDLAVNNVAPVAAIDGVPSSGTPNTPITLTASATDVGTADTAAGFTYAWTVTQDGNAFAAGSGASFTFTPTAAGSYAVSLIATDKDAGASSAATASITVAAAGPAATFADVAADEGAAATIGFTGQSGTGPFTYSYDFNNDGTFEIVDSTSATAAVPSQYTADGPGAFTVAGRITDANGLSQDYAATVTVNNLAPTATFAASGTFAEGAPVTFTLSDVTDAAADAAAGFTYSFDLDGDGVFETVGTSATATKTFADNGVYVAFARVTDKDGAFTDYATQVNVGDVAPDASISGRYLGFRNHLLTYTLGATDVSSTDTAAGFTYAIDWNGDGTIEDTYTAGSTLDASHSFSRRGIYNITVTVTDKDGLSDTAHHWVIIL